MIVKCTEGGSYYTLNGVPRCTNMFHNMCNNMYDKVYIPQLTTTYHKMYQNWQQDTRTCTICGSRGRGGLCPDNQSRPWQPPFTTPPPPPNPSTPTHPPSSSRKPPITMINEDNWGTTQFFWSFHYCLPDFKRMSLIFEVNDLHLQLPSLPSSEDEGQAQKLAPPANPKF